MGGQAFLKDLTLPLVQRNLIGTGRDAIPQRLDITGHPWISYRRGMPVAYARARVAAASMSRRRMR
jgi:hypothetical protein